ncbi:ATP-binding protein [Saccharopolyspora sp. K220]|uniref:ATP-binding protein n=1 Tax=Saccharopolyspora soli TaxID=2926618 RepID=UPI001F5A9203|nr:ATP-binding protein [Saccharopolyspora soli]MCI2423607.1 ATP-binding protein [Saccharopolyspora soli]
MVTHRLPALVESLNGVPVEVPGLFHQELAGTPYAAKLDSVIELFTNFAAETKQRADRAAKATLTSTMRGVQSLANEQQLVITEMQHRHDDPEVLVDLLKIDHANSQLARRAQATAVLCGSWPGQQRAASPLIDLVRGGTSRIRDYLRVKVHTQVDMAVVSRAVEPVVLALAELLDNAARYSQPNTSVEVHFQPAHNGISIVIDDAGVGMNAEERERTQSLLSAQAAPDINRLGDPPQIGFALAGVLAARYGFKVFVEASSPYGGMRAVVFLPNELLTRVETRPAAVPPADEAPVEEAPTPRTAGGLPKRRRKSSTTSVADAPTESIPTPTWGRGRAQGMGAWQRGTRSGRTEPARSRPNNDEGTTAP